MLKIKLATIALAIIVLLIVMFSNMAYAEEKPLIINFTGYGETTQFTCKVNEKQELDCEEVKKKPMNGVEFFTKLMGRRI